MKKLLVIMLALLLLPATTAEASFGELEFVGFPKVVEVDGDGDEVRLDGWIRFNEREHEYTTNIRIWVTGHEGRVEPAGDGIYVVSGTGFIAGPLYDGDMAPITIYLEGVVGFAVFHADDLRCPYGQWGIELVPAPPTPSPTPTETPEPTLTPDPTPSPTVSPTVTPGPTISPTITPEPTLEPTVEPTSSPTPEPTESPTPAPTLEPQPTPEPPPIEAENPWVDGEEWFDDDELWGTAWVESWRVGVTDAWLVVPIPEGVEVATVEIELSSGVAVQWNEEVIEGIGRAVVAKGLNLGPKRDEANWLRYRVTFDSELFDGEITNHKTRFLWKWKGECWGNEWEGKRIEGGD